MGRGRENRAAAYLARLQSGRFEAKNLICCDSSQAVKTLVRKGSAVGVAYKEVVADEIRRGELRALRLKKCNLTVESYLIYSNQSPLSPSALAFRELLEKYKGKHRPVH